MLQVYSMIIETQPWIIIIIIIIVISKNRRIKAGSEWTHPLSPMTPAQHSQPKEGRERENGREHLMPTKKHWLFS